MLVVVVAVIHHHQSSDMRKKDFNARTSDEMQAGVGIRSKMNIEKKEKQKQSSAAQ